MRRYGEKLLVPLAESGCHVIVRPHPQSAFSEVAVLDRLKSSLARFENVEWDFSPENLVSLSRSDAMISDFSGIIFDYAFLFGRPILYANADFDHRPYDSSDLSSQPWKFAVLPKLGRALDQAEIGSLRDVIESLRADRSIAEGIAEARDTAWRHRSESGARAVDFILERVKV